MICFLPFRGEFGWYLCSYVRMIHRYNGYANTKIVCIKPGHECLFPSANAFFYDWKDIPDEHKAGIISMEDEGEIKRKVIEQFGQEDIEFISPSIVNWDNRHTFFQYNFVPQPMVKRNLTVDVVITPRKRKIDPHRNWDCTNWQIVVNELVKKGYTVGVCGTKDTSCELQNVLHKSYDHTDIDSDVELMMGAKLVITQESGLQYLSFMCRRPTFCIGHYHKDHGADLYRDLSVPFRELGEPAGNPYWTIDQIVSFLESKQNNDSNL